MLVTATFPGHACLKMSMSRHTGAIATALVSAALLVPGQAQAGRPDPDRAFTGQAQHLAFGAGRHFCLGAMLSRFEIEISLGRIIDRLPGLTFDCDAPPPDVGLFLRGPATLPVRFDLQ